MSEEWRPVVGYEGLYEVSSLGRVRATRRRGSKGGLLSPGLDRDGHPQVSLYRNQRKHTHRVHTLVAKAFLGPQPTGLMVRHLDGVPANNVTSNLAWGTNSENQVDRVLHGHHFQTLKTHCPQGHEYTEANTYWRPDRPGSRECRTCNNTPGPRRPT